MATTANRGYRKPDLSFPPNAPLDIGKLADDIDADVQKNNRRRLVAAGYLTAAFSAGQGGAAGGSLAIPSIAVDADLVVGLELTPPGSTAVTALITWTGDARVTSLLTNFRTMPTTPTSTGNKHDAQFTIPVVAGPNGVVSFTVTPNVNGCTARLYAWVVGC